MDEENKVETTETAKVAEVSETAKTQGTTNEILEKKGCNISSMIFGIVAAVFCFTGLSLYVTLPCSIFAIIFSIAGRKDAGRGMGIAGLILGIISLVMLVVIIALGVFAINKM